MDWINFKGRTNLHNRLPNLLNVCFLKTPQELAGLPQVPNLFRIQSRNSRAGGVDLLGRRRRPAPQQASAFPGSDRSLHPDDAVNIAKCETAIAKKLQVLERQSASGYLAGSS